jgi:hypothetical protein
MRRASETRGKGENEAETHLLPLLLLLRPRHIRNLLPLPRNLRLQPILPNNTNAQRRNLKFESLERILEFRPRKLEDRGKL